MATRLLESLDENGEEEVSEEWLAELRRRVRDIEEGKTELIPSEEVWKRIDERFGTQFSG